MTLTRFRSALAALHWSQRGLAAILGRDERQIRRWASGAAVIPENVAVWLDDLARYHEDRPYPTNTRALTNGEGDE